jgi:hypothetical protein
MVASSDTDAAPASAPLPASRLPLNEGPYGDVIRGAQRESFASPFPLSSAPAGVLAIARAASAFETLSLAELGSAALMDRIDTKFLVPAMAVPGLLDRCVGHYRLLEVNGTVLARYNTRYFDTPDLRLYHAHHAGRTPRVKVRVRTYVDSKMGFLEIKLKTNKERTLKARVPVDPDAQNPLERLSRDAFFGLPLSAADLRESVVIDYTRLTLVRKDEPERLTLDLMLSFTRDGRVRSYPGVVVAEVKQERRGPSYFHEAMRELGVREGALSKYCLGIASLEERAKKNRFKGALRRLQRIGDDRLAPAHL